MAGSFPHKIIIYGDGLAGQLAATALLKALPKETDIILLGTQADAKTDIFYGSVTSPSIYDFFLSLGISEPEVLLNTSTSFSLGTQYEAWGADNRSWTQSFHTPLPLFGTVGFHHYLKRLSNAASKPFALSDYIMSVQAAEKGVFAHPPEGQKIPLATVKYGYHFHPFEWVEFLSQRLKPSRIKEKKGSVKELNIENGRIISLTLADGQQIDSDLVIDCGGQDSIISQALSETNAHHWQGQRRLKASVKVEPSDAMESVCRKLTAHDNGWAAATPLQGKTHHLTLSAAKSDETDEGPLNITLGRVQSAWTGNCVRLGLSAAALEPLTPAPLMILQRDIERLLELLPVSDDMRVEEREYNRRFADDYDNAASFHRAFFGEVENADKDINYWQDACREKIDEKLINKITQFESRGVFATYDYEPFSPEDWAILHFGMGRDMQRYDPLADRIPEAALANKLSQMKTAIKQMADKMPPHQHYMSGLLKYLKEKHG